MNERTRARGHARLRAGVLMSTGEWSARTQYFFLNLGGREWRAIGHAPCLCGAYHTNFMVDDDDELNTNPPTPFQIGKRPPAPNPKRESAGHQGVAGGGYSPILWFDNGVMRARGLAMSHPCSEVRIAQLASLRKKRKHKHSQQ